MLHRQFFILHFCICLHKKCKFKTLQNRSFKISDLDLSCNQITMQQIVHLLVNLLLGMNVYWEIVHHLFKCFFFLFNIFSLYLLKIILMYKRNIFYWFKLHILYKTLRKNNFFMCTWLGQTYKFIFFAYSLCSSSQMIE